MGMRMENNPSVMACFMAGIAAHNRRKTVCAGTANWADGEEGFFLTVSGEEVAVHHPRFGYVVAKQVAGRHARKIRNQFVKIVDGHLTWAWDR
jgi:hypothetical protein